MHSYSLLQPRIRDLTAVTAADVIASFPPAELATHVRSAQRLIPALIREDILSSYVGIVDRSRQDETMYALPLNQGGNAAYWLLDELRSMFKGALGVDTDVLAQCASLAFERRALLTDNTYEFWASQQSGPAGVRAEANDALDRHPALGNLLMALLSQWNTVLVETACRYSMSQVRLFRTITVGHHPALARRRGEQCCKASCSRRTGDFVGVSNPPPNVGARPATARYVRGHGFRRRPATHRPGRCCSSAAIRPRSSGTGSPSDGGHTAGKIVNLSVARQGSGGRTREIRENYAGSFLPRKWPGRDAVQTIMLT